ncbi:sodium-dependent transporter [Numidum massiliense]|uniref:sodium-dependent transporter n=1 Tax=Numidum massiliense TaxID=1522315 RepID=UPI0006D541B0|nr:sodium-dependent transporter [Numidum massiliense]
MEQREQWGSRAGFILAAVGSAIGLGNIWRYPYIAYENGGGAFLIPYLFALLTAGIPILILEYAVGQKMRGSAPLSFRRLRERWEWLGWWQVGISFFILTYYTVIVGWALSYTYFSIGQQWGNKPEEFLFGSYLGLTETGGNIWNLVGIKWGVFLPVAIIWAITFFILFRGIRRGIEVTTKILMPILVIVMIVITIRAVTLPGAAEGLNTLLQPDWKAMANPKVWVSAYGQIFFSLSIAFAIMITYASYLPKKSDLANNGFIAAFANSGFEFLAAFAVFGALGFLAQVQGVPVKEVAKAGIGLAFAVFPEIINQMPAWNDLFGVLFFGALTVAGLTSSISIAEVSITAIREKFNLTRTQAVSWVCGAGFFVSLLYTTYAGMGYLDIVDNFINNYSIVLAGLVEVVLLGWFFKLSTLRTHINGLSDIKIGTWWDVCLKVITPLVLITMSVLNVYNEVFVKYYGADDYTFSQVLVVGWGAALAALVIGFVFRALQWKGEEGLSQ